MKLKKATKAFRCRADSIGMRKKITIVCLVIAACCFALSWRVQDVRTKTLRHAYKTGEISEAGAETLKLQSQALDLFSVLVPSFVGLSIVVWPVGATYKGLFRWHAECIAQAMQKAQS